MSVIIFIVKCLLNYATMGLVTTAILLVFGWRVVEHLYGTRGITLTGWKEPLALLLTVLLAWPLFLILIWEQNDMFGKEDK